MTESPYSRLGDQESVDGRKIAARARLNSYQLEKLKFLACSIVGKTQVEETESVGVLYDLILGYYGGNEGRATETLCTMLEKVSCKFNYPKRSSLSSTEDDILANTDYQWRVKIVNYADKAKKQKTLRHIYDTFELEMSTTEPSSPMKVFEHMIESGKLEVGENEDLVKVERAMTSLRE